MKMIIIIFVIFESYSEIDRSIDEMAVLRKDKWLIEGRLRK